ncbi:hypothetical protein S1OALGB6SA_758 [Olavius algarvensis spirochete endosymbiont]|uniref:alpha/beta hydrolase n=1 Tax=Olavius algarvensis spirochete endosymbiont TaxID=260710 RepID=UPI00068D239F|nr:alpha/beta fold hydrolase [Olavius algarvensis spirochete endosymbiont]VDA99687.1 hypothetical protein S1OALGB6SA_758 [Olavius algarvensis spirochete endosymbiont]
MKFTKKSNSIATIPIGLPYEIHPSHRSSKAVLALHGYTGAPGELRFIAEHLGVAGFAVAVPRLPGAGTDLSDLSTTSRHDWMRRSYDAWLDLRSRYERVSILGYSMGGLLALKLAMHVTPEKLVLLAPALKIKQKTWGLMSILSLFSSILPEIRTGWEPNPELSPQVLELGRRYWVRRDFRSGAQLYKLRSEIRRNLKKIQTPVMAVVSEGDKSVPITVLKLLKKKLPAGLDSSLTVSNCGHDLPQGADKSLIADAVLNWLKSASLPDE